MKIEIEVRDEIVTTMQAQALDAVGRKLTSLQVARALAIIVSEHPCFDLNSDDPALVDAIQRVCDVAWDVKQRLPVPDWREWYEEHVQ